MSRKHSKSVNRRNYSVNLLIGLAAGTVHENTGISRIPTEFLDNIRPLLTHGLSAIIESDNPFFNLDKIGYLTGSHNPEQTLKNA